MKTLSELYDQVDAMRATLRISNYPAWFRGNTSSSYELLPSALRTLQNRKPLTRAQEINTYDLFLREALGLLPGKLDDWEVLSVMQHYGCPTRLLDWTDSLHVALFFAVEPYLSIPESDWHSLVVSTTPRLWILNPYNLNKKAVHSKGVPRFEGRAGVIYNSPTSLGLSYTDSLFDGVSWPFDKPIAISHLWHSARIRAQRGYFTLHGDGLGSREDAGSILPLESRCPEAISYIDITRELIHPIIGELRRSRTDYRRLMPDLEGISRYIARQFLVTQA